MAPDFAYRAVAGLFSRIVHRALSVEAFGVRSRAAWAGACGQQVVCGRDAGAFAAGFARGTRGSGTIGRGSGFSEYVLKSAGNSGYTRCRNRSISRCNPGHFATIERSRDTGTCLCLWRIGNRACVPLKSN